MGGFSSCQKTQREILLYVKAYFLICDKIRKGGFKQIINLDD